MIQVGNLTVSRETFEALELYAALLTKWNSSINLVSKSSLTHLWERHIVDSSQVFSHISEKSTSLLDIGSGGGFPGLVIAIIAKEKMPGLKVSLVESDQRKCAFLQTVAREVGLTCAVHSQRIEDLEPQESDYLTARALSDLSDLLAYADRHLSQGGTCLFLKGKNWKKEVIGATDSWCFSHDVITSETSEEAVILKIEGISHG